jgi:hypothetical protein
VRLHPGPPLEWRQPADLLGRGAEAFTARRFYEAQSLWEAEALGTQAPTRGFIQGLATIAAGMLALDERRVGTAERLLARGRWLLAAAPAHVGTTDVGAVRAAADVVLAALRGGDPADAAFGSSR